MIANLLAGMDAFAHEAVTVDNTAGGVPLTSATYNPTPTTLNTRAKAAVITAEGAQSRYRTEGAPTPAVGHLLEIGDTLILTEDDLANFKAIRTGSTNQTLRVTYYR